MILRKVFVLFLIVALFVGCSENVQDVRVQGISVNDLAENILSVERVSEAMQLVEQPFFLSVSDGGERAVVYRPGSESEDSLASGLYFRVDFERERELLGDLDFRDPLPFDASVDGLVFGDDLVLLPQELMAYRLVDFDDVLLMNNLEDYIREDLRSDMSESELLRLPVYRVEFDSFYFERPQEGSELIVLGPFYRNHVMFERLDEEVLFDSVVEAGEYLKRITHENGQFDYVYLPDVDRIPDDYNVLRHAGTVFSMLQLYELTGDEDLLVAAKAGILYLKKQTRPCFDSERALCLLEDGSVKLGGNGLGLLAITKYMEVTGDLEYLEWAQGLAMWAEETQGEDGRFTIHKQDNRSGEVDDLISGYYPGEMIFGLMRLYAIDGDERWVDVAEKNADYLINVRDAGLGIDQLNHDHWLLYSLNELYRVREKDEYLETSARIVESIFNKQRKGEVEVYDWVGSYYDPPRSTPTATRTEGLMAAYNLFHDYGFGKEAKMALETAERGIRFQLQTQVTPAISMYFPDPKRSVGAFFESLTGFEIRIDYVQHNLSGILAYYKFLAEEN